MSAYIYPGIVKFKDGKGHEFGMHAILLPQQEEDIRKLIEEMAPEFEYDDTEIRSEIETLDGSAVKSVNGNTPDAAGNVVVETGGGAVDDVQVNGTSILQDGVANIPWTSKTGYGVVKIDPYATIKVVDGTISVPIISEDEMKTRKSNVFVDGQRFPKMLKYSIGDGKIITSDPLTAAEQENARDWLGIYPADEGGY